MEQAILELVEQRGPGRSICPSEAARAVGGAHWRSLMPRVRRAAANLQGRGLLRATRRGADVAAESAGGPIRLQLPAGRRGA